ncbi:MAG: SIMPL domain-containing protein [Gemmatimonadales bacterium]
MLTTLYICPPLSAQPATMDNNNRRITVTGEAVVNVAPDRVVVTLGIETRDTSRLSAKHQNDSIAKATLALIKRLGVAEKDIQTDQLSIFRAEITVGGKRPVGYLARNIIAVTLNDRAKVEGLISGALDSGVTDLFSVDFQTSELKRHREQAREMALKAAREKAEKMAAALGARVGGLIEINETGGAYPLYYSSWGGWFGSGSGRGDYSGLSQNTMQVGAGEVTDGIALGKVAIRAAVGLVFELMR